MTHLDRHTSEHGASLLEYTLLLSLVALVALGGLGFTGRATAGAFEQAATSLEVAGVSIHQAVTPATTPAAEDQAPLPSTGDPLPWPEIPDEGGGGSGGGRNLIK